MRMRRQGNFWRNALAGLLMGIGCVLPGVLGLVALGFAASALASMKAVQWLFDHARGYAYYAVLGFLLVSVALVFPGFGSGWTLWMQLAALLAGMLVARRMSGVGEPMPGTKE